jgi:hypothetical protein
MVNYINLYRFLCGIMEKHMITAVMGLITLTLVGSFGIAYAHTDITLIDNFISCLGHLEEAKEYTGADWGALQIQQHCLDLISEGQITIQREGQRDIVIFMVNAGDAVELPLMVSSPSQ